MEDLNVKAESGYAPEDTVPFAKILIDYFVEAIALTENKLPKLFDAVMAIKYDAFDRIYYSLLPTEQTAFEFREYTEEEELARYMIMNKCLHRYYDAENEVTGMSEDGVLLISPLSSVLELPINLYTWQVLSQAGVATVQDCSNVETLQTLPTEVVMDVTAALLSIKENNTIRLVTGNEV